jgi:type I restriction enzyme M protein
MTFASLPPWAFYREVAPAWHQAGAHPLDIVEVILEMLAIAKHERGVRTPSFGLGQPELTSRTWNDMRRHLTETLGLPPGEKQVAQLADQVPGLLEQTRRAVISLVSAMSEGDWPQFSRALLEFLAFAPQTGMRDTSLGYFRWPPYLAPLIKGLLGPPSQDPIYCPFDSSGWLPLLLAESGWVVRCETANLQAARVQMLFAFLGEWELKSHVGDPLRQPTWLDADRLIQFENSAAITSFGHRYKNQFDDDRYGRFPVRCHYGEALQVAHLLAQTRERLVIIVPEGFLFRTAGGERDYKEHLVRRGLLSSVIRLPRDVLAPYTNVQSSILIFESARARGTDVLFVDATEELSGKAALRQENTGQAVEQILSIMKARRAGPISARATYDQIAAQDFNISVDRYVRSERERLISNVLDRALTLELIDIAEIIRPQAVASRAQQRLEFGDIAEIVGPPTIASGKGEPIRTFREVSLQDIQLDGLIRQPSKLVDIDDKGLGRAARQQLEPGDVLLSVRGRVGPVGIVPQTRDDDSPWIPAQTFVILRLRSSSPIKSPIVLYRYLASPLGQGLLQSLSTGATVPMIQMGDVKSLRVIIPALEEQRAIEHQHSKVLKLRNEINELERLARNLDAVSWPMTKITTQTTDAEEGNQC